MAQELPQPNVLGSGNLRALSPLFWLLVVATGIGAGIAGGLLMLLLRMVEQLAFPYRPVDDFLSAVKNATPLGIILVLIAAGVLAAAARLILQHKAKGGHGGEVVEKIWFAVGRLDPVPTFVRAIVSNLTVGMGASLGREAAPKQTGALIAGTLAQWAQIPNAQRRLLVACGAGAWVAAVYNVPFGGAMFALEVLLGTISLTLVPPALAASMIATAVSWLLLPNVPTFDIPFYPSTFDQIVFALLAGPIAGLVSVGYVRLISAADAFKPVGGVALVAPVLVFAALGALAVSYPELLGNGKDTAQEAFVGQLGLPLVAALVVLKPVATAACLGSGAPGGLFMPTITLGALAGGVLGNLWLHIWSGAPLGGFAIVGACAVLAASTQGPVCAVILMLELTRRLDTIMVPAILATAGAVVIARLLEHRSIYSARIHVGRSAAGRAVGEQEGKDFIALSVATHYIELLQALMQSADKPQPVYVVDEDGKLQGEVPPAKVKKPSPDKYPLETSTAADFATKVAAIPSGDAEGTIADTFAASNCDALPVIERNTHELVGIRRRHSSSTQ